MRRRDHRSAAALGLLALTLSPMLALGAGPLGGKDKDKPPAKKALPPLKVDEVVGDLAKVPPLSAIRVEGVGLVVGLDNTGSDPAISGWRTKLLDEMRKARVEGAERLLASPTTSLVLLKGEIPAGMTTDDAFDVDVELDPNSTTTSLAGGQLVKAELRMVGYTEKGELLPGKVMGWVAGAVMTGSEDKPDDLARGRVLGGAKVKKDIPYGLAINDQRKSVSTAALLQRVINTRFSRLKGIDQEGMARGINDRILELNIPASYHHNQYRYFQVVENLAVLNSPELTAIRKEKWGKDLLDPKTAGAAAIRLEGIGRNAVPTLKEGLASAHPQVRFFAAEALAYLGDDSGVDVLSDAAQNRPEFRAYSFAALAAMDQPAAIMRLRELMACPEVQVRYGAFNALRIVDRGDPSLGRVRVRQDDPVPDDDGTGDMMAARIAAPARSRPRRPDPFELYVVDCEGPPLVHVARSRRCEIVVFGKGQSLLTPAVLGVGAYQVNASDGDVQAQVSRIAAGAGGGPDADQQVPTSLDLAQVIREAANLGATYPEILSLLQSADRQKNLPGQLVVDAVPSALAAYEEAQVAGRDATAKVDPAVEKTSAEKEKAPRKGIFGRMLRRPGK